MGLTAAQFISEAEVMIELSGTDVDTSVGRYLNLAGSEVWNSHPWREKETEVVVTTVAPYGTGKVAVTIASTALTFTGATLNSGMVGAKFALTPGGPYYRISSVNVGAGTAVIARAYQEATSASTSYSIFQDEYDVATDVDVLRSVDLLYTRFRGHLRGVSEMGLDDNTYLTAAQGIPVAWAPCVSTTAGTYRIRMWPIPNAVFAARVLYMKAWTDISGATANPLGAKRDRLLLYATVLLAQKIPGSTVATTEAEVVQLTEKVWREQQTETPLVGVREMFDRGSSFTNTIQIDTTSL